MPHNITGSNVFTNPVPAYADGDPVAQASNDPTIQALANRDTNLKTRLDLVEPAFSVQHNTDGTHKAITTPSVTATGLLTAGTGLKAKASGNGSDTIDGFRQGTFSLTVSAGTIVSQNCRYTRIGNLVFINARIRIDVTAVADGTTITFPGLPYAVDPTYAAAAYMPTWMPCAQLASGVAVTTFSYFGGGTTLAPQAVFSAGSIFGAEVNNGISKTSSNDFAFNGHYHTAAAF